DIVNKCGCIIVSQTQNLVPADKKLYALRDATSTVESLPLIATSIMSKKIASGNDIIFLDVKCGEGSFMQSVENAKNLANIMLKIGSKYNKKVATLISNMDEPIGYGIGCNLEILDAIDVLKGKQSRLYDLVKFMAIKIMTLSQKYTEIEAHKKFEEIINNGLAYNKFLAMIEALGGDINCIKEMKKIEPTSKVLAKNSGYISKIKAKELGLLVCQMGGGRENLEDGIDYTVGIKILKHIGDKVEKDEPIALIFNTNKKLEEQYIANQINEYISIDKDKVESTKLFIDYKHN
ncbi:MAG: thymidine phosphorylase, partial [Christensenellales bacterium]